MFGLQEEIKLNSANARGLGLPKFTQFTQIKMKKIHLRFQQYNGYVANSSNSNR